MNILVFVKQVPDTTATIEVDDGRLSWGDASLVINPWDEIAVESALQQKEEHGGEVTAVSLGTEESREALKHALAMGCDRAIMVVDPALGGADTQAIAHVMSSVIDKIGDVDLLLFGRQSVDTEAGVTASQVARLRNWPMLTLVSAIESLDPDAGTVKVRRAIEEGWQVVEAPLPAVMNFGRDYGEPRYPSFIRMRKAAKAEMPVWSLGDLGMDAPESIVRWTGVSGSPQSEVETEMISGTNHQEIAEKLVDKIMEEKVL